MDPTNDFPLTDAEQGFSRRMLQTGLLVDKYYTPLLCLLGAFGNSLSLVVFCMDAKYRRQSSSYYLSALAVSDSGFLLNLFAVWLEGMMGGVITSDLTCPLVMYLGQVTCFMSVYLTVGFSLERFIAINFPFSRPRICTRSKAKKVIAGISTVALLLFSYAWIIAKVIQIPIGSSNQDCKTGHSQWMKYNSSINFHNELSPGLQFADSRDYQIQNSSDSCGDDDTAETYVCTVPERYFKISEVANYLDSAITLIIPFLFITYFNVRIAMSVWRLNGQRQYFVASFAATLHPTMILSAVSNAQEEQQRGNGTESTRKTSIRVVRNPLIGQEERKEPAAQSDRMNSRKGSNKMSNGEEKLSDRKSPISLQPRAKINVHASPTYKYPPQQQNQPPSSEVRVTKTLLLVSTVFLVLNLPLHAIRCAQFIQTATGTSQHEDVLQALQPWANMLFNTNFAVNFLLYCVSGRNFRKTLKNIASRVLKRNKLLPGAQQD